ncbi:hypothetical protein [Bacillus cereus]|uniref:hypothetical protein n=1 Tax=Bacillus cereus TaxID=1396 RepID=UPI000BEE0F71|nr:hypothetical protein [Bacillus cereus]PEF69125.1 hypothetical protein CON35_08105 [Bacillus cereus]
MEIVINCIQLNTVQLYSGGGFGMSWGTPNIVQVQYTVRNGYHELSGKMRIKFEEYKKLAYEDIIHKIETEWNTGSVDGAK